MNAKWSDPDLWAAMFCGGWLGIVGTLFSQWAARKLSARARQKRIDEAMRDLQSNLDAHQLLYQEDQARQRRLRSRYLDGTEDLPN